MSLLILFRNGRILLIRQGLALHYIGSTNTLDVQAGGENQLHFIGTVGEVDAL